MLVDINAPHPSIQARKAPWVHSKYMSYTFQTFPSPPFLPRALPSLRVIVQSHADSTPVVSVILPDDLLAVQLPQTGVVI